MDCLLSLPLQSLCSTLLLRNAMTRSALVQLFIAYGVVAALCPSLILLAEEPQASQLLPNTTVAYLEIPEPATTPQTVKS